MGYGRRKEESDSFLDLSLLSWVDGWNSGIQARTELLSEDKSSGGSKDMDVCPVRDRTQ